MELLHPRAIFEFVLSGEYLLVRKFSVFDWQQGAMYMRIQLIQMYNECRNILFTISATNK